MKIAYQYYWNEAKDAEGRSLGFFGFKEGQSLSLAYEGELDDLGDVDEILICEALFEVFNINHPADYRGPSMSVGSVIKVGDVAMACMSCGWVNIDFTKSEIVKAWWKK